MKKLLLLLMVMGVMTNTGAQKISYEYEGTILEYTVLSSEEATVRVDYMNNISNVPGVELVIPGSIQYEGQTYKVTEIKEAAFRYNDNITSVTIPNTIKEIGSQAFYGLKPYDLIIEDGPEECKSDYWAELNCIKCLYLGRQMYGLVAREFLEPQSSKERYEILTTLTIGNLVKELYQSNFMGSPELSTIRFGSSLKEIQKAAFSHCPNIQEVILPPNLKYLREEVFAECIRLRSIVMGPNLLVLGSKVCANCPIRSITMTGLDIMSFPNLAPGMFDDKEAVLTIPDAELIPVYEGGGWTGFERISYLKSPMGMRADTKQVITGKVGDTIQLEAILEPSDVTLPYIFWTTSDPEVAIVSLDGLVTLQRDVASEDDGCKITAMSLYDDGPTAEFIVGNPKSGIEEISDELVASTIDYAFPYTVYGLDGRKIDERTGVSTEGLAKGIYILRQGDAVKKVVVN